MSWTKETEINLWNDSLGERINVRPDRDGLGLVEVVLYDDQGKEYARVSFTTEAAVLLGEAIREMVGQLKADKEKAAGVLLIPGSGMDRGYP